jgi:hypothetical protein
MADPKKKNPSFVTPKGAFRYPALVTPDFGTKEYPKEAGEYKVVLILSEAEAAPLIEKLKPIFDEAVSEGQEEFAKLKVEARKKLKELKVNDFYTVEYDKETEEETGNLLFKFSMNASGKSKKDGSVWNRKPALFDAKGKPLVGVKSIWGGTLGKVSFEAAPYFIGGTGAAGLKLRLNAAQIIELNEGGNKSSEGYGFGEEDGYEASPANESGFSDESGEGTDGNDPKDF